MSNSYDVIVIGSGAGGGTLVHRLAPSGKRILLLERGGWLPREPQNWRAETYAVPLTGPAFTAVGKRDLRGRLTRGCRPNRKSCRRGDEFASSRPLR
jgi:choline dehydrogenase-like flavoprotein